MLCHVLQSPSCVPGIREPLAVRAKLCELLQVVEGKLSAGELSSFVIYALYVGSNVGSLASVISNLIQVSTPIRFREPSDFIVDPSCALSSGQTLRHYWACSKATQCSVCGSDICLDEATPRLLGTHIMIPSAQTDVPLISSHIQATGTVQAVGASRRVFELLDREPKQPPAGEATPKGSQGGGEVIFENVWCARHTLQMPVL